MNKNPEIVFDTIKEFKKYALKHKLTLVPAIRYTSKKHQNSKGEYLHEMSGIFTFINVAFHIDFAVLELKGFKKKKTN